MADYRPLAAAERGSLNAEAPDLEGADADADVEAMLSRVALTSRRIRLSTRARTPVTRLLTRFAVPGAVLGFLMQTLICARSAESASNHEVELEYSGQDTLGLVFLLGQTAGLAAAAFLLRKVLQLTELVVLFVATMFYFASVYTYVNLVSPSSFEYVEGFWIDEERPAAPGMAVVMLYMSASSVTTVGLGDITASGSVWALLICDVEMLLSVVFHVGLISQALPLFTVVHEVQSPRRSLVPPSSAGAAASERQPASAWKRAFRAVKKANVVVRARRVVRRHLLLITALWQAANLLVLEIVRLTDLSEEHLAVAISAFFQLVQFFVIFVVSYKFVHRDHLQKLPVGFLVQSYLSVVLNYGGFYLMLYLHDTSLPPFSLGDDTADAPEFGDMRLGKVFARLVYLSLEVLSTVGFGDVFARTWYTRLAVTAEMMVSTLYGVVVLSVAMARLRGLSETRTLTRGGASSFVREASLDSTPRNSLTPVENCGVDDGLRESLIREAV